MRRHHTGRVACAVRVVTDDAEAFVAVVIMFIMFIMHDDDDAEDAYSSVNTTHNKTIP